MTTCNFCPLPDFTNGWTNPPMCEAHLELALIRARLTRAGRRFTLSNVQWAYQEEAKEGFRWTFTIDRIPELMNQMLCEDFRPVLSEAVPA